MTKEDKGEMRAVTRIETQLFNGTILLSAYDSRWPSIFSSEARRVRDLLGDRLLRIEHAGSTSVPGLAAKPIIDMVLVVADSTDEQSYVTPLEEAGYILRVREPDWFEHRLLRPPDILANIHVFSEGCVEINRMLKFRDWLRKHADDRTLYEDTKRELAARIWKTVQDYADAKSDIIHEILDRQLDKSHPL